MAGSNSGRIIPREELSEFQRWQFSTLLEEVAYQQAVAHSEHAAPVEILPVPLTPLPDVSLPPEPATELAQFVDAVPLPTAEEIEAIERQAQEEGYQSGLAAGRLAAESEVNRLRAMLGGIAEVCHGAETRLADDVLDLVLVVARQFLRDEVRADRNLLLPAIREAIAGLPTVKEPSRLLLNPEDLTAISVLLAGELPTDYWRFAPDPSLSPGSCWIETPVSSVDLSLASRWNNTLRVLGRSQRSDLTWHEGDEPADTSVPHAKPL